MNNKFFRGDFNPFYFKTLMLFLTISFVIGGCKKELSLKKVSEFSVNHLTKSYYNISSQLVLNKQCLIFLDKIITQKLYAYSIKDGKLVFVLDLSFLKSIDIDTYNELYSSCFYFSEDKILVLGTQKNNVLYEMNYNSEIIKTYKTSDTLTLKNILFFFISTPSMPFIDLSNDEYVCSVLRYLPVNTSEGRKWYYHLPKLVKIKLLGNRFKLKELPIYMPYIVRSHPEYNFGDFFLYYTKFYQKIVYGIMQTPWIYTYNLNTNVLDSFYLPSKFIVQDSIKPFDSSWYYKDVYINSEKYFNKTPFYMDLFYNPFKNCFFRIVKHAKKDVIDGKKNQNENWSLLVFDENFKNVGEIPFLNDSLYNRTMFAISENGFVIGKKQTKTEIKNNTMRVCEFEVTF